MLVVVSVLLEILVYSTLLTTHDCTKVVLGNQVAAQCSPSFVTQLFGTALISAVLIVVFNVAAAGLYKGATNVTDGKPFSVGQMFDGWDKAQVVIAAVIIAVATAIGSFLCYIPGLIVGFFTMFTILFVVDKQMTAVDAIKASVKLVTDNLGQHDPVLPAGRRVHPRRRLPVPGGTAGGRTRGADRAGLHLPPAAERAGRSRLKSSSCDASRPTAWGIAGRTTGRTRRSPTLMGDTESDPPLDCTP